MVVGLDITYGYTFCIELLTMYWRRVMLIPGRVQFSFSFLPLFLPSLRAGSLVGIGGFSGRRKQFSHWFVIGSEVIISKGSVLFSAGRTSYVGWLIPVGYEFRHFFGRKLGYSWGLRPYIAPMPVFRARYVDKECAPSSWFCSDGAARVNLPFAAGVFFMLGFR